MSQADDDEREAERLHDIWDEQDDAEDETEESDGSPQPEIAHLREPA